MDYLRLMTLQQVEASSIGPDGEPRFSVGVLRGWLQRNINGMREACVVKVGRRMYIDVERFGAWLELSRSASAQPYDSAPRRRARATDESSDEPSPTSCVQGPRLSLSQWRPPSPGTKPRYGVSRGI